jgi:GNAT superfamily N-acetyltransferase
MSIIIKPLEGKDIPLITRAPSFLNFNASEAYFRSLLDAQAKGERVVVVAYAGQIIVGFVTIKWQSEYLPFAEKGIPEINDLRVLAEYRRRGIATVLMDAVEKMIFERSPVAGLAVGLYADYGPAQQMYIRRGYTFDGRGLISNNEPVKPGNHVFVDDNLVIYLTKERP